MKKTERYKKKGEAIGNNAVREHCVIFTEK
jgi:hypothetical protein